MKESVPKRDSESTPLISRHLATQSEEEHPHRNGGSRTQMDTGEQDYLNIRCCPVCGQATGTEWLCGHDRFHRRARHYMLLRCGSCSFVWLTNPPTPATMSEHYGKHYDAFIGAAGDSSPRRWQKRRKTLLKYKTNGSLLDVGCGSGAFLETLKGASWELYGIEMSIGPALKAQARSGAQVFVGDVLDAPFEPNTCDVVTCLDVLEHLFNPREVLSRISEWLKPGGIVYVLVPNIESGEASIFKSYWYGLELPRHLSHFSLKSLRYLATSVGLEEVSLIAHPNSTFEYSTRYLLDDILHRVKISRSPLSTARASSIPWRAFRKLCRMTILPLCYRIIALAGPGEHIHAVFKKHA